MLRACSGFAKHPCHLCATALAAVLRPAFLTKCQHHILATALPITVCRCARSYVAPGFLDGRIVTRRSLMGVPEQVVGGTVEPQQPYAAENSTPLVLGVTAADSSSIQAPGGGMVTVAVGTAPVTRITGFSPSPSPPPPPPAVAPTLPAGV